MIRSEAESIVADVRRLHEICTSLDDISRAVHLPSRVVQAVLTTGKFPEQQPRWIQGDLLADQPRPEHQFESFVSEAEQILAPTQWEIGRIASECKEVTGKTDAELGERIGLSRDQVQQRRSVWDRFGDDSDMYRNLKWSHFHAAMNWDDAAETLKTADRDDMTVAVMVRYHDLRHGKTSPTLGSRNIIARHRQGTAFTRTSGDARPAAWHPARRTTDLAPATTRLGFGAITRPRKENRSGGQDLIGFEFAGSTPTNGVSIMTQTQHAATSKPPKQPDEFQARKNHLISHLMWWLAAAAGLGVVS